MDEEDSTNINISLFLNNFKIIYDLTTNLNLKNSENNNLCEKKIKKKVSFFLEEDNNNNNGTNNR